MHSYIHYLVHCSIILSLLTSPMVQKSTVLPWYPVVLGGLRGTNQWKGQVPSSSGAGIGWMMEDLSVFVWGKQGKQFRCLKFEAFQNNTYIYTKRPLNRSWIACKKMDWSVMCGYEQKWSTRRAPKMEDYLGVSCDLGGTPSYHPFISIYRDLFHYNQPFRGTPMTMETSISIWR